MCLELSETGVAELFSAFAKAQAEMGDVVKGAANDGFKRDGKATRYADLASVVEAIRPALNKHSIAIVQAPAFDGERVSIETRLVHAAGGWMRSTLHLKPSKVDPQGVGSAITYGRRYALLSIAGVAPEDDDGNAASGEGTGGQRFDRQQERREEPADAADVRACFLEIDEEDGPAGLQAWGKANAERIGKLTPNGQSAVRGHFASKLSALKPKTDAATPFDDERVAA